jgi:hypothetical protein
MLIFNKTTPFLYGHTYVLENVKGFEKKKQHVVFIESYLMILIINYV